MKKLIVIIILISIGMGSMFGQKKNTGAAKSQTNTVASKNSAVTNQPTKTGAYTYKDYTGIATYSYIVKNGGEIKQGPFSFKSKLGLNGTFTVTGIYDNDIKTGNWTEVSTWSIYNGEEHVLSDFYFSQVSEYRPFKEITKRQTVSWLNGRLNGKEIILFTQKESWGASGGGQKTIVYKKEKTWKNNVIQDFKFESFVNNERKEFLNGKYATQGSYIVYDGQWTGIIDSKSMNIVYDKGVLKSALVKIQGTGAEVLKQETYLVDSVLISKFNDNRNISVKLNDDDAKLIITKTENNQYEFEVISSQVSGGLPDNYVESLTSKINYVEKSSPYGGNPEDSEWTANKSTIKKNYLSQDRNKGEFWNISADNENAVKIFETIDEGNIEYIGNGSDFFSSVNAKNWSNEKLSYFNRFMYLKYLIFKGKADKALNLFLKADESKLFDDDHKYWNLNLIGTVPYYFISICLAGDLNKATEIIKNNINNSIKLKDGSVETWVESVIKNIKSFLPYIEKNYPQDRIIYLKGISQEVQNIKSNIIKSYFDSIKTVSIGNLKWSSHPIELRQIDISNHAIYEDQVRDRFGNIFSDVLVLLNDFQASDINKINSNGWRLPSLNELKDLFARNLTDYDISILEVNPMVGDKLKFNNPYYEENPVYPQRRYLCRDENNKIIVYNASNNSIMSTLSNGKNKVSGFCLLIKTQ